MRKKISSFMTSKNILIALTVLCCFFIGTSFFTDTLTKPLKKCVSMVVVPVQKGMNNIGFWVYDKYQTLQEISVVLDENKNLQSQIDELTEENNQLKQDSYELNRLELLSGHLPQTSHEIALTTSVLDSLGASYELGQEIELLAKNGESDAVALRYTL